MDVKPTLKTPATSMGKKFEKVTNAAMNKSGVDLNEVDNMLNEKEQSLKKKIFRLGKMETLVHGDPKLSAKYAEMAENGEEKYGYHYNETIMNMLFNDYILHSMKYLQKYKSSPEAKKKRRDKSGIHQLEKLGQEKIQKQATNQRKEDIKKQAELNEPSESVIHNNSLDGVQYMEDDTIKENDETMQPQDDDCFIESNGFKLSVSCGGKFVGEFVEDDDAYKAVKAWKVKNNWYPQTWFVSDHGNMSPVDDEGNSLDEETGSGSSGAFASALDNPNAAALEETTTSASSGQYSGPAAWGGGDLMKAKNGKQFKKPIWLGGTIIQESNYLTDPIAFEKYYNYLNERHVYGEVSEIPTGGDDDELKKLSVILNDLRQKGAVDYDLLVQTAEEQGLDLLDLIKKIVDARKQQTQPVAEETKEEEVGFIKNNSDAYGGLGNMNKDNLNIIKKDIRTKKMDSPNLEYESVNEEFGVNEYIVTVKHDNGSKNIKTTASSEDAAKKKIMAAEGCPASAITSIKLSKKISESMVDDTEGSMVADNPTSMKMKPVNNTSQGAQGGVPAGFASSSSAGAANEATTKYMSEMEELNKFNEDLDQIQKEMNELKEDRKPSALVLLDRLKADNKKNFKKDFKTSDTGETIELEDEIGDAADGIVDVDDPMKLGEELEAKEIKNTDAKSGEALKNVGDSANQKGDEIPKRNDTKDESHYVNMVRGGQQNLVYDNEPGERFEDRRKKDMGKEFYQRGEDWKEMMAQAPMYNKDTQPVDNNLEKVQFDKEKAGWASRQGFKNDKKVAESVVTGKYMDGFNKTRIIDFKLGDVNFAQKVDENWSKLSFAGLGNSYDNRVQLNEGVKNALNEQEFYVDEKGNVFNVELKKTLNESKNKNKPVVNEEFNKMKHLISYNGGKYVNNKNNKRYVD
jgi:hypothetical protein